MATPSCTVTRRISDVKVEYGLTLRGRRS